jgi:hypothetical protein
VVGSLDSLGTISLAPFNRSRHNTEIDPSKPKTLPPPPTKTVPPIAVVPDHLESLVVNENEQLKSFCRIRMPEEYVLESESKSDSNSDNKDKGEKPSESGGHEGTGEAEDDKADTAKPDEKDKADIGDIGE